MPHSYNPCPKPFRKLCVSGEENAIQVDPLAHWTVMGVTSQTPFTLSCTREGSQLCSRGRGGEKNLFKAGLGVCIVG